jgi:hypothetical protein
MPAGLDDRLRSSIIRSLKDGSAEAATPEDPA